MCNALSMCTTTILGGVVLSHVNFSAHHFLSCFWRLRGTIAPEDILTSGSLYALPSFIIVVAVAATGAAARRCRGVSIPLVLVIVIGTTILGIRPLFRCQAANLSGMLIRNEPLAPACGTFVS